MPTPTIPHVLLTAHGGLPGGEVWSCGLRSLAFADPILEGPGQQLALAAANRWRDMQNLPGIAHIMGNNVGVGATAKATLDGVTVRQINEDGQTVQQYEASPVTALVTQNTTAKPWPNQCAIVVTLVTGRAGRTGKGRVYLPAVGSLDLVGDRIPAVDSQRIADAFSALITGLNLDLIAATGPGNGVAVQSGKVAAEPGILKWTPLDQTGYMGAKVIAVRVGDVVDTQRRRRKSVAESYTTKAVA